MLTDDDVKWLLKNLPIEIVRHVIASYDPSCFFIMDWLLNYDWTQQCRLTFGFPHKSSVYTYYKLCQNQKPVRLACGYSSTVIVTGNEILCIRDGKEMLFNLGIIDYVACGDLHTIFMTADRKIYGRGRNSHMQLSDDERDNIPELVKINAPDDVTQIGAGYDYTAILRSNGVVMISGRDFDAFFTDYKFREMELPKDIVQIACGSAIMFVLRSDGTLMACGKNESGELGIGDCGRFQNKFVEVNIPKDVIQVACGGSHALVLRADGSVMACGKNTYGQLGMSDGNQINFKEIENLPKDVVQIACGSNYSFVLRKNGCLMSCGANHDGQLGVGDYDDRSEFTKIKNMENVAYIGCGGHHTVIMKTDGTVLGCGNNRHIQLGIIDYTTKFEKITVSGR